jgi:hypothetical protein
LPSNATSGGLSGASAGTVRHALTAIAVLAAIALLGIGWALIARSRRDRLSAR